MPRNGNSELGGLWQNEQHPTADSNNEGVTILRPSSLGLLSRIPEGNITNYLQYRRAADYCRQRSIYQDQKIDLFSKNKPRLFDTSSVEYPQRVITATDRTGYTLFLAYREKVGRKDISKYRYVNEWRDAEKGSELRKEWKARADELVKEQRGQVARGMIVTKKKMGTC
ncbi:hypothetical protein L5515_015499 [Caenorhabditis briggsae]|uniref:Uncharacterized protein n=1 Tax=Caenorhabditis briggsae TaxID=6238 RepID=A0AAE9J880_CAEBR|nr:hypothetical protein L5515_015499 [Caenorhabditis briggsae]